MIIGNVSKINYDQHVTTTLGCHYYPHWSIVMTPSLSHVLTIILKNINRNYLDNIYLYTI